MLGRIFFKLNFWKWGRGEVFPKLWISEEIKEEKQVIQDGSGVCRTLLTPPQHHSGVRNWTQFPIHAWQTHYHWGSHHSYFYLFLEFNFIIVCVYEWLLVYTCVLVCVCVCKCPWRIEESIGFSGARVAVGWGCPDMDARNWTLILYNRNKWPQSHLSSPQVLLFLMTFSTTTAEISFFQSQ